MIEGRNFRVRRKILGLTITDVSLLSGISKPAISYFERFSANLGAEKIRKLERALAMREGGFMVGSIEVESKLVMAIVPTAITEPSIKDAILIQPYPVGPSVASMCAAKIADDRALREIFEFVCQQLNERRIRQIRNAQISIRKKL